MTGTTPATAASKRSWTPCSRAHDHSSSPCWLSSCLLAVTTWRPARHRAQHVVARGSRPPMTSTIRSERSRMSSNSPRLRVSTPLSSGRRPVIARDLVGALARAAARRPSRPCRGRAGRCGSGAGRQTSRADEVVEVSRRTTSARVAVARRRRPAARGDAVVGVGHRVAVGAGGRRDDHVARARVGEVDVAHDDVARLAVLADEVAARRRRRGGRRPRPRSARRRASGAGCPTSRRRPRRRCRRCA